MHEHVSDTCILPGCTIHHPSAFAMNTSARTSVPSALVALLLATAFHNHAATLTVTNLADNGPGTLRARIAEAAPDDTINFGVVGKIVLNSELVISKNLRIEGPGANFLTVSGNHNSRVFNIVSGAAQIYNMVIADGRVVGTNGMAGGDGQTVQGGGIRIAEDASLVMSVVAISNNVVIGGQADPDSEFGGFAGNGFGGGIANFGTLTMTRCVVASNSAFGGTGGATGAGGQAWGAGIYSSGNAEIRSSTLYGNTATAGSGGGGAGTGAGGAIFNFGQMVLRLCTITSNAATSVGLDFGGAIDNNGFLLIFDCTIVGNAADWGGGITGGEMANTILAGNNAPNGPDGTGTISSGDYNLIQDTSSITFTGTTTHNITGQDPLLGPLQFNGGGDISLEIPTLHPLPGSPVIDKGMTTSALDQRGFSRPFDGTVPNAAGGDGSDIGAVEVHPGSTLIVLNTNNSGPGSLRQILSDNFSLGGGNIITFAPDVTGTITLNSPLTVNAPALIRGPGPGILSISGNSNTTVFLVLEGPTEISGLTIRDGLAVGSEGMQGQKGFDGRGGGIFSQDTLTVSNCVLLNNQAVGGLGGERHLGTVGDGGKGLGGGIYNAGANLSLVNVVFDGNTAIGGQGGFAQNSDPGSGGNGQGGALCTIGGTNHIFACSFVNNAARGGDGGIVSGGNIEGAPGQGWGAGIYSESMMMITDSTISLGTAVGGNGAPGNGSGYGGGIFHYADLFLASCTIASNSAVGSSFDFGGGIYSGAPLTIYHSTIAGNQADFGGGLHGTATAGNTIFAGNAAGSGADVEGTIDSLDYNLIQNPAGVTLMGATEHVLLGVDPELGPLADNGGPTKTMALAPSSPAVDKGKSFDAIRDQRGMPRRFDLPSVPNAEGGDGADIGAFEFVQAILTISNVPPNVIVSWPLAFGDFTLESTASLSPPAWAPFPQEPVLNGAGHLQVVTNATAGNLLFRLRGN